MAVAKEGARSGQNIGHLLKFGPINHVLPSPRETSIDFTTSRKQNCILLARRCLPLPYVVVVRSTAMGVLQ
jgi:hypothetical protein